MLTLVCRAVRARTAQALTVLILTALAGAAAVAGPWYLLAASSRTTTADVAAAPAAQRTLSVTRSAYLSGRPGRVLADFRAAVDAVLPMPGLSPVVGLSKTLNVVDASGTPTMSLAYRDAVCEHVRLAGSCPTVAGDVAVSRSAARALGIDLGARVRLRESPNTEPVALRVVGLYDLVDPAGAYWSDPLFRAGTGQQGGFDPAFTAIQTFEYRRLDRSILGYGAQVPDHLIRGDGGYDLGAVLREAEYRLRIDEMRMVNPTQELLNTLAADRSAVYLGVSIAVLQILLLSLFALGLAGRWTARDRRADVALLKLHGSASGGILRLTMLQHLLPMLAGLVVGGPAGYLAARLLVGPVTGAAQTRLAVMMSVATSAAVLVGGLLVLVLVEVPMLRRPVGELLRRVPGGRRDRRSDVVDVLLIAAAAAAVYQAGVAGGAGLTLAAPVLVVLATALLLGRLLGLLAGRVGGAALHAGRLRLGLSALQFTRQPGTERVFALLVVAVAGLATAAGGWFAGAAARADRSEIELGAARVLTVQAANRTALQDAVRRADPDGRYAMAAVANLRAQPPVLAVDAERLAAVGLRSAGASPIAVALRGQAGPVPLPPITGSRLVLHIRSSSAGPVAIVAKVQNAATGVSAPILLGPFPRGPARVSAPVTGCEPGCRLVGLELVRVPVGGGPPTGADPGTSVSVLGLTQQDPAATILDAADLGDIRRWRADLTGFAMNVSTRGGVLDLGIARGSGGSGVFGNRVFVVDSPLPLPVVLAGAVPPDWRLADPVFDPFGAAKLPVRVSDTSAVLPVLGRAGVVMDIGSVERVTAGAGSAGTYQVWLGDEAPATAVQRLRDAGLSVLRDDILQARQERLAEGGTALADRFRLFAGVLGMLIAGATVAVAAAVERQPRLAQLRALRMHGLSLRAAETIGYAGYATLIGCAVFGGLLAAAVAGSFAGMTMSPFTDGWREVEPPDALRPAVLAAAGLVSLGALGLIGWLSTRPLTRRLRAGAGDGTGVGGRTRAHGRRRAGRIGARR